MMGPLGLIALLQAATPAQAASAPSHDLVVVGRRPPADPPPEDSYSTDDIASFGANSVSEAIDRIKQGLPADPGKIPVIVNGKRVGSMADIGSLPAGAIERVDILPPSAGTSRGFGAAQPVVNLVLKQHYRATMLEAEASATGDARDDTQSATLRLARIDGERRKNATITVKRSDGLHAGDRFDEATLAAAPPGTTARSSLTAATDRVDLDAGRAMPWGQNSLSISANASFSDSRRDLAGQGQGQNDQSISANTFVTLNGTRRNTFWSLTLLLNKAHNTTTLRGGSDPGNPSTFTRSDTLSENVQGNASGPLLHLLGHTATYDANLSYQNSSFRQSAGIDLPASSNGLQDMNASGGLSLPLHERGKSRSLLGQLTLGGHVNAQRSTGSIWVTGYDGNASWSPLEALHFDVNRNVTGSPGGFASLLSVQTDVLVFDPRTRQDLRVTQLTGSNPTLRSSTTTTTNLRATFMQRVRSAGLSLGASYTLRQTSNPSWTPSLSDVAEQAFPDHFLRDASGQLVQVDMRPVNALRQSDSQIGMNLRLSGGRRPQRVTAASDQTPPARITPFNWSLSMSSSWKLRSDIQLTATGPSYDLNNASIGTSAGGSRRVTRIMGNMLRGKVGGRFSLSWTSANRLLGQGGADGTYRQPLRIDLSAFTTLLPGKEADSGLHLTLAVDNLLNRRPIVTFPDRATPFSQRPANLDPLGRVIRLGLRTALK